LPRVDASSAIADVMIVTPDVYGDSRGRFIETYRRSWFPLGREMLQGNRSDRQQGALVGLHYHFHQSDYWYVTRGRARVVLHDLRLGSPTEGATEILEIGEHDDRGLFIPPGVSHGFAAVTDLTLTYLVDSYYNPATSSVSRGTTLISARTGLSATRSCLLVTARTRGSRRSRTTSVRATA